MSAATESKALPINYKTPEKTYQDALNFDNDKNNSIKTTNNIDNFSMLMGKMNKFEYVYPAIAIFTLSITLIIIIYQKSLSTLIKGVLICIFIAFIAFTVIQFKNKKWKKIPLTSIFNIEFIINKKKSTKYL